MMKDGITTPFLTDYAMEAAADATGGYKEHQSKHPFSAVREDCKYETLQIEELPVNEEEGNLNLNNGNLAMENTTTARCNSSKWCLVAAWLLLVSAAFWGCDRASSWGGTTTRTPTSPPSVVKAFGESYDLSTTEIMIDGPSFILSSTIPSQLGYLTELTYLHVRGGHARIGGPIPTQLGLLTALTDLDLHHNQLTGSIPSELGQLTALTNLNLSSNSLEGSIPSQLGELKELWSLELHRNHLTGHMPKTICELPNLDKIMTDNSNDGGWMCP